MRQTICSVNYEFLLSLLYFVDQVHIEADRKAMANQVNVPADLPFQSRTTYRIRNKVAFAPPIIAFSNIVLYLVSMYAEIGAALVGFFFSLFICLFKLYSSCTNCSFWLWCWLVAYHMIPCHHNIVYILTSNQWLCWLVWKVVIHELKFDFVSRTCGTSILVAATTNISVKSSLQTFSFLTPAQIWLWCPYELA